jgi:hypothetical protein
MRKSNYEAEPAQIMRTIVKNNGKQIFLSFSKKRLAKIIVNSYGKHKEIGDMLIKAAEFGIPAELLKLHSKDDREQQIRVLVRRFSEKYKVLPESEEVNDAVSCFTFALDYGMFNYVVYPQEQPDTPPPPAPKPKAKAAPAKITEKQPYIELKDIDGGADGEKEKDVFLDFKTWFEKKRIEEDKLKERDNSGVYVKGGDNNYYELVQTDHLTQAGTEFDGMFKNFDNFDPKKREREIIKMGIDICSEIETAEGGAPLVNSANIFRDKYGNYRLSGENKAGGRKQNSVRALGLFMREMLKSDSKKSSGEMLETVIKEACGNNKYGVEHMKKDLEYAFETALEEWLFAGPSAPSVLTAAKASAGEFTHEDVKDMSIPDEYAAIGARAFIRRRSLRSVIVPNSIESVCGFAFGWCENLENVTIEGGADANKTISIGNFAFWGCENLRKVTMRGSFLKDIGDCVFYGCRKLKVDIYGDISGDAEELIDRVFYGTRDSEINIYTEGTRKGKRYDRIFNNRVQFY